MSLFLGLLSLYITYIEREDLNKETYGVFRLLLEGEEDMREMGRDILR
jgi:hypothetical protein